MEVDLDQVNISGCLSGLSASCVLHGFLVLAVGYLALTPSGALAEMNLNAGQQWANPDLSVYGNLPIDVKIGLTIDQITHVDQKSENFGVVGDLRLEWVDPNLVFVPQSDQFPFRRYETRDFVEKTNRENIFSPSFIIYNQQGRNFSEDTGFVIFPRGRVVYGERFTATLQAPDFNFKSYPFDVQRFFVAIDTPWPESFMRFVLDEEYTGLGDKLGEEEWIFQKEDVELTSRASVFGEPSSRITFAFSAHRQIWYYMIRIFFPLLIIVAVSWTTFFLRDFSKRADISAGNLLVYVAFNFTISSDLPRLGYMTFMDAVMAATFIITGLTVIWNVVLKRLEIVGRERIARVVDSYTLWIYPVAFLVVLYMAVVHFF